MIKYIRNLFKGRKQQCIIPVVSTSICYCGKDGYECDVFNLSHAFPKKNDFMQGAHKRKM